MDRPARRAGSDRRRARDHWPAPCRVADGLARSPLALALLPLGTANVLANEIGLPTHLPELARIAALLPARPVWPGEAVPDGASEGRRFLVMAGIGFDAEVVEHLDLALKRCTGKLAYVASILGRLCTYERRAYRGLVDGRPVEGASLVAARAHFYGGRFVLAPDARLEDPTLQVVLFRAGGRRAALGYMAAMGLGLLQRCRTLSVTPAQSVHLAAPVGAPVQLDGDVLLRLPSREPAHRGDAAAPRRALGDPGLVHARTEWRSHAPATVMPSIRMVGASMPVLNSRSLATVRRWNMSLRLPATVTSLTG